MAPHPIQINTDMLLLVKAVHACNMHAEYDTFHDCGAHEHELRLAIRYFATFIKMN